MASIPQITRDRLASSVVGTPGVDTSGMKIADSLAGAAEHVSQAIGDFAIDRQNNLDVAEQNRLSVNYKMATLNGLEKIKSDYATNPEKSGPAFMQLMKDNLSQTQAQASNPRVSLMVGRGDPYFDTHVIGQQQGWAYKQRNDLNVAAIQTQGNQIADQAENVGRSAPNLISMVEQLKPLASMTGNLLAGTEKTVSPESAAKLKEKMLPTLYSRAFYGSLQDNPARAYALTQHPDVQAAFAPNPKELDAMSQQALKRVEGMAKQEEWKQIITPLVDSPQLIKQISSGQVDWNKIQTFPDGPFKTQMERMALQGPAVNATEKAEATAKFFADAADIGVQSKYGPSGKTVSDLVKFNTELMSAHNDGLVTPATFQRMLDKLAVPLRDSVLKAKDPETLNQIKKSNGFLGMFSHHEEPDQVVDKYVGGYNTINNWMKSQGQDQDWQKKSDVIKKYMDFSDSIKPEDRDTLGRPWTPQTVARSVMGILEGRDVIDTPIGPKKISGYNDQTGKPTVDFSPAEIEKLNHLKALSGK